MKKTVKILINSVLCIAVLLSLVSCNVAKLFPRMVSGPTAWENIYQYMWVETYDEMLEIVERTRAHGTEIPHIPAFNCEEYGLDIKFAIEVKKSVFNELNDKYEYFDRKINDFSVRCYIFFEDVTLDQVGGYKENFFKCMYVSTHPKFVIDNLEDTSYVQIKKSNIDKTFNVLYKGSYQFGLIQGYNEFEITEEQIEILEKTITIIE